MDNNFNWDSVKEVNESKYLVLGDETQFRMGSSFKAYEMHIEDDFRGNKKRVNCPSAACPLCKIGKKTISRYAFKVINRDDGKVYILEVGGMIMNAIKKHAINPKYGNPLSYDILIKKTGTGKQTRYEVLAAPQKTSITPSEVQALNEIDIEKYIKPLSIEDIKAIGFKGLPMEVKNDFEEEIKDSDWENL